MENSEININIENKSTIELFEDFIEYKDNRELTSEERSVLEDVIGAINEG